MRIGVLGDTHGDAYAIRQVVTAVGHADMWLHTGDFSRDAQIILAITGAPITAVSGNCDGHSSARPDEFIEVGGCLIWLTHGHRHGVKQGLSDLVRWATLYEVDAVVYGHTHRPHIETVNGILLFNPGSASEPHRGNFRTCGVLEISEENRELTPRLICLP